MSITLPDIPDGHVWISSPGWMFDHWHWAWFVALGLSLLLVGLVVRRLDGRSFATGLAIVLALGPLALGLICGGTSAYYRAHPWTQTSHQTWSLHETGDHAFRVPRSNLSTNFSEPARDPGADRATINRDLASAFSLQVLQPSRDAQFIRFDSTEDEQNAKANHAPAYSIGGQVYSCVFLTSGITTNAKNQIIQIDVTAAQCLQGERSVRFTIH